MFDKPVPVPPGKPVEIATGIHMVNPLSRRGTGPGIIVLVDDIASGLSVDNGIPTPFMKWAEEGYCVVEVLNKAWLANANPLLIASTHLEKNEKCEPKGPVGLVCYSAGLWQEFVRLLDSHPEIVAAVVYIDASGYKGLRQPQSTPTLVQLAGKSGESLPRTNDKTAYEYADQSSHLFATPNQKHFSYATEAVSHTRNLTFLKRHMKGPYFDLETLWDEHTYFEFAVRSVEDTMATMVQEPYVNHIPTITGGIGRADLTDFYANHFIFSNPDDCVLELVSRTVGVDRVVDEFIFCCTHDRTIPWLLPGVPPSGKKLEIPFMAVVNIRGDRLYHEHIHWDQATALRQAGCLPECLPYAAPAKVNGAAAQNGDGKKEIRLPVAGRDAAQKMRDKSGVVSNAMFVYGVSDV